MIEINEKQVAFINNAREIIKEICNKEIKEKIPNVTIDDINKIALATEYNTLGVISYDTDILNKEENINKEDIEEIVLDVLSVLMFLNAIDKNKRQTYFELQEDIVYKLFDDLDEEDYDKLNNSNNGLLSERVFTTIGYIECGENVPPLSHSFTNEDMNKCISELYALKYKDKIIA